MFCAVPSRVCVDEPFELRLRLLGEPHEVPSDCWWGRAKPNLRGQFNLNVPRRIRFIDNCLPEWAGTLRVEGDGLDGPLTLTFDGRNQGVYAQDLRPVGRFGPFRWRTPGMHFLRLIEPSSGLQCVANATWVTESAPQLRIYWGDPHWQTYFSDGIRAPEELYTFARDEGFLDFGAITDHVEALTDRQWDYFVAVTNDFEAPGRFATLLGQEWTNHKPGHRNIYYRADHGPVLRSTDPRYDTLERLWQALDGLAELEPLAIPHHSANHTMGVDWDLGWNPRYEKAVEVYSVWGSSECHADDGNPRPIGALGGEVRGQHVIDALRRGYQLGFMGGGDVHDGRPGEALHALSYPDQDHVPWPQGLTACLAPKLSRGAIFDAIRDRRTYATTNNRTYLDIAATDDNGQLRVGIRAASHEGIRQAVIIGNAGQIERLEPTSDDTRCLERMWTCPALGAGEFIYVRIDTAEGELAWSSPMWGGATPASRLAQ